MNRLYLDIETSPNLVLSWRVGRKVNIDHENIVEERKVICVGYKWEKQRKAEVLTWDESQNDAAMLRVVADLLTEADEVVAHNGDRFDLPWLQTRFAFHRIPAPPRVKTIDTLQWMKRRMYFNSNRLDYVANYLGFGRKIKMEFGLWKLVMGGDPKALARMAEYCARDVELLQKVHEAIEPYSGVVKTHVGVLNGRDKWTCPYTGSKNVQSRGKGVTALGVVSYRMRNMETGRWYRISKTAHDDYNAYLKDKADKKKP